MNTKKIPNKHFVGDGFERRTFFTRGHARATSAALDDGRTKVIGIRRHLFHYDVAREQAADRLSHAVTTAEGIIGQVSADNVKLRRQHSVWFQNSFDPIFVGSFTNTAQGAILSGRFRSRWITFILMFFFIGMSAKSAFDTWSAPAERPGYVQGWRDSRLKSDLQFLAIAVVFPALGWAIGIPSKRAILKVIDESSNKPLKNDARKSARTS